MPLPPAFLALGGPAAAAAAKAAALEYLPAVSSASLAALLLQLAWKRVPDWIKEDVAFRKDGCSNDVERLSTVLEKIQLWMEAASKQLHEPVPYLWATLLIYWQLSAQLQQQQQQQKLAANKKDDGNNDKESRDDDKQTPSQAQDDSIDFRQLKDMLNLATWAYYVDNEAYLGEQLETQQLELLQTFVPKRPGSVGYYVAKHSAKKILVIGVKGTTSLTELLTDACGRSVSWHDENVHSSSRIEVLARQDDQVLVVDQEESSSSDFEIVSGHERIWIDQDFHHHDDELIFDDSHHVKCHEGILLATQRLLVQVEPMILQHKDHQLVLVGHSLGASAACLLGSMLRSWNPKVYAFAPPPVLDHDSAIAASSYVTSVVNQSDFIARCSLVNLAVLLALLQTLARQVIIPQGLAPTGPRGTSALLRQLALGDQGKPLWTAQELAQAMAEAEAKVELRHPSHLYVPGKLYYIQSFCGGNHDSHDKDAPSVRYSCTLTDPTAPSLRTVAMSGYRMLGDHTVAAYHQAIDSCLLQATSKNEDKTPK